MTYIPSRTLNRRLTSKTCRVTRRNRPTASPSYSKSSNKGSLGVFLTLQHSGLIAGFLLAVSSFTFAAPIDFYGIGGVAAFNKPVTSLREGKFTNLVEQKYDFSCGAAALTTILRYAYHKDVTELDIMEGLARVSDEEKTREKGFSLLDLRHYIDSLGMRGRGYEIPPHMLQRLSIPAIVQINIRGYHHFVVFKRIIGDEVYLGDPALGNKIMTMDEFLEAWNGSIFVIIGKGFDRNTVLRYPEPALTAHSFLYDFAPVTNAELLDFGFTHADLF